jgi:predicted dehydrogenase
MFGDVEKVSAMVDNFNHKQQVMYEDTGVVCLKFSSGLLASIHFSVNAFRQNMEGSVTVFGEKGTIKVGGRYLNKLEYIQAENIAEAEYQSLLEGENSAISSRDGHEEVYRSLIGAIVNNHDTSSSLFEAMKTVEIIERIYKSAAQGG